MAWSPLTACGDDGWSESWCEVGHLCLLVLPGVVLCYWSSRTCRMLWCRWRVVSMDGCEMT